MKREFVNELIYPAVQANCIYEVRFFLITQKVKWFTSALERLPSGYFSCPPSYCPWHDRRC